MSDGLTAGSRSTATVGDNSYRIISSWEDRECELSSVSSRDSIDSIRRSIDNTVASDVTVLANTRHSIPLDGDGDRTRSRGVESQVLYRGIRSSW